MSQPTIIIYDETKGEPKEFQLPEDIARTTITHLGTPSDTQNIAEGFEEHKNIFIIEYRPFPGGGGGFGFDLPWEFIKLGIVIVIAEVGAGALQKIGADLVIALKKVLTGKPEASSLKTRNSHSEVSVVIPAMINEKDLERIVVKINEYTNNENHIRTNLVYDKKTKTLTELPGE